MNDLVKIMQNDAVVSSLQIAEHFGKQHRRVMQTIDEQFGHLHGFVQMFRKASTRDSYGREQKIYYMNRDGFALLVMGFTGRKALEWKLKYIAAFNEMERILFQRQTMEWKDARLLGKQARREETDEIKNLVSYAESQGSKHADKLYINYSRLVKKMLGIESRETADTLTLSRAAEMERIIRRVIMDGIAAGENYKAIYQAAKARLTAFKDIVYLPV